MDPIKVLCVDDEPQVLQGLSLHLSRKYLVFTATGGEEAMRIVSADGPFTVVLSDMRMPGMNGAALLSIVRQLSPDTVRILLTGHTDIQSAIAAINEGQVFRFLTKPCPPDQLLKTFELACEQYRLITAERVLLEQTLRGSIQTLVDILSMTNPIAFGKASRIRQTVVELMKKIAIDERWPIEVAAMVSQLGAVALPETTMEKYYYGVPLEDTERKQIEKLPETTRNLLTHIPRLEPVREILSYLNTPLAEGIASSNHTVRTGVQLLRIASAYDQLETRGMSAQLAIETLRKHQETDRPELLDMLLSIKEADKNRKTIRELPLKAVRIGMVFADDVKLQNGMLFVGRGYEVTPGFVERIAHFKLGMIREPVRIFEQKSVDSAP
jgi:CheY-like chemotaxis protein